MYKVCKKAGKWVVQNKKTQKVVGTYRTRDLARAAKRDFEAKGEPQVVSVKEKAKILRKKLVTHYKRTGGFPSHRYVKRGWGFDISLKAIVRHRAVVMKELGIKSAPTTTEIKRGS